MSYGPFGKHPVYYSPDELAEFLKVTRRTVYNWLHSGQLQASKAGKGWRVSQGQLDAFLSGRGPRPSKKRAQEAPAGAEGQTSIYDMGASEEGEKPPLQPMASRSGGGGSQGKKKSRRR